MNIILTIHLLMPADKLHVFYYMDSLFLRNGLNANCRKQHGNQVFT